MSTKAYFSFPTNIYYGAHTYLNSLTDLSLRGHQRPLLVTNKELLQQNFIKTYLQKSKDENLRIETFLVSSDPTKTQVDQGATVYKKHKGDCIIALGGGSAMDAAKAIALKVNHKEDLFEYEDGLPNPPPIDAKKIPYLIALPTTSGTGSEVGRSAVISDDKTKRKVVVFSPHLLPRAVYLDPLLTLNLPPALTAQTGFDALTHLIEAFLAKGFHPLCDAIALEGFRMIAENLGKCYLFSKHPQETEDQLYARGQMMIAASMGAIAFQKGLGVTHSCAHALSTVYHLPHGLANAIMLPFCLQFNKTVSYLRLSQLAQHGITSIQTADKFIPWIEELKKALGLPQSLKEAGLVPDKLETLIKVAIKDGCHQTNPRPVQEEDFRQIFKKAFEINP
ncbi:MAG: iron-containing alcohol dehydrogenase [Bdellovibrio sp.]|nr:MAG: iron-containing alcohol dehydrogenase [Bdellovibrio sp.]